MAENEDAEDQPLLNGASAASERAPEGPLKGHLKRHLKRHLKGHLKEHQKGHLKGHLKEHRKGHLKRHLKEHRKGHLKRHLKGPLKGQSKRPLKGQLKRPRGGAPETIMAENEDAEDQPLLNGASAASERAPEGASGGPRGENAGIHEDFSGHKLKRFLLALWHAIYASLSVGNHRYRKENRLKQDGSFTGILLLIVFVAAAVAMIMAQWITKDHVEYIEFNTTTKKTGSTPISPYMTELFLIVFLLPGIITICCAFHKRDNSAIVDLRAEVRIEVDDHHNKENVVLYMFAAFSISYDLLSSLSEMVCFDESKLRKNRLDNEINIAFYIIKPLFTIAQCMFLRKFYRSHFVNAPILHVFLISIIGANMSIWFYTMINDDHEEFFHHLYDDPGEQVECGSWEGVLSIVHEMRPYFAPFTLEFSLLVFEKVLSIWLSTRDLNQDSPAADRSDLLIKCKQHKADHIHELHHVYCSRLRMQNWVLELQKTKSNDRNTIGICFDHHTNLDNLASKLKHVIGVEEKLKNSIEDLQHLNRYPSADQLGDLGEVGDILAQANETRIKLDDAITKFVEHDLMNSLIELNTAKSHVEETKLQLLQTRSLTRERGYKCGKLCSVALMLGILYISFSVTLVIMDVTLEKDKHATNSTCFEDSQQDSFSERDHMRYIFEVLRSIVFLSVIVATLCGFYSISRKHPNGSGFNAVDVFYSISCFGLIVLISFSIISAAGTTDGTEVFVWQQNSSMSNISTKVLSKSFTRSCKIDHYSKISLASSILQLIATFLTSSFTLAATQVLPHGNPKRNDNIGEIIQFLGTYHLLFWFLASFIINSNLQVFYPVEHFYLGDSYATIVRLTMPLTIYYYISTAIRLYHLNTRFFFLP